jgi:hypothetical protein
MTHIVVNMPMLVHTFPTYSFQTLDWDLYIYTYMWSNIMEPKQVGTHECIDGLKELSIHGRC